MKIKSYALIFITLVILASPALAATKKFKLSGKVEGGNGYSVILTQKNGLTKTTALTSSGKFSFSALTAADLKGASLQLADTAGKYAGPIVLAKKGNKVTVSFSGKVGKSTTINLGKIVLSSGYGKVKATLEKVLYSKPLVPADINGKPAGAGELGLVSSASISGIRAEVMKNIGIKAAEESFAGADGDLDGIPDTFDVDDDGDLILDASDPDSDGKDIPYTALNFDFRRTLNAHIRSGLTDSSIDAAIGGENVFSLTFFYSLPSDSAVDGGHVICDDSLVYCRKDTPSAYYGGISESSSEFRDHPWSELLNSDGYPRMEKITVGGSFQAIAASIQPRVGRSQFSPGDVYRVVLTSAGSEVSSRSLALTPYFVSVPALKEYNAGSGSVTVDYSSVNADSGSIPGAGPGDPIILSSEGLLTLTFWRPQRGSIRSDESGYFDWGNLHYGVVIESTQASCGGLYSGVSSELTADSSPLGDGDSPFASSGANMYPYTDTQGDRAASSANTLTMTVNLKDCLTRTGSSAGTYRVNVGAVGQNLTGGQNSAVQAFYVQIP